jgi:lysyl-tRNA synthetase class 1
MNAASPEIMPFLNKLVQHAINYYNDFIKSKKCYPIPTDLEMESLNDLLSELNKLNGTESGDEIQKIIFEVGKRHKFPDLKAWFNSLYRNLLGQEDGPRMGSFTVLYGIDNTKKLLESAIARK